MKEDQCSSLQVITLLHLLKEETKDWIVALTVIYYICGFSQKLPDRIFEAIPEHDLLNLNWPVHVHNSAKNYVSSERLSEVSGSILCAQLSLSPRAGRSRPVSFFRSCVPYFLCHHGLVHQNVRGLLEFRESDNLCFHRRVDEGL